MSYAKMNGKETGLSGIIDISGQFESPEKGSIHFFPKGEAIWGNMAGVYDVSGDTIYVDLYSTPKNLIFGDWSMIQSKFAISSDGNISLTYEKIYYGGHYTIDAIDSNHPVLFKFKPLEITPRIPKFIYATKWLWNDENIRKKYEKVYTNSKR